jgi:uncharacterized protein with HEPN domain
MSQRDDFITLRQMIDHTREATSLVQGRSREILDEDRVRTLALVQLAQIVGEAARRLSPSLREGHPEIEWAQIIALRNRLIHGYDSINLDILWQILAVDFPRLVPKLEALLSGKSLSEPR